MSGRVFIAPVGTDAVSVGPFDADGSGWTELGGVTDLELSATVEWEEANADWDPAAWRSLVSATFTFVAPDADRLWTALLLAAALESYRHPEPSPVDGRRFPWISHPARGSR